MNELLYILDINMKLISTTICKNKISYQLLLTNAKQPCCQLRLYINISGKFNKTMLKLK